MVVVFSFFMCWVNFFVFIVEVFNYFLVVILLLWVLIFIIICLGNLVYNFFIKLGFFMAIVFRIIWFIFKFSNCLIWFLFFKFLFICIGMVRVLIILAIVVRLIGCFFLVLLRLIKCK